MFFYSTNVVSRQKIIIKISLHQKVNEFGRSIKSEKSKWIRITQLSDEEVFGN